MKISFIIPFHNEEKNCIPMLDRVVKFALQNKFLYEIIPIDDRSTDNTKSILTSVAKKNSHIKPIYRKLDREEEGNTMGKALIEGTKASSGSVVIWTMGDLADDAKTYLDIVDKINEGFDIVFGSRYMPGGSRGNLDVLKASLSSWGTLLARIFFGIPVHDITNAFRGFKKEIFEKIKLDSTGFSISPEFAIKAYLAGFRLGEVPTVYTNRVEGVSSFKIFSMIKRYLSLYLNLFLKYKILQRLYDFIHKINRH